MALAPKFAGQKFAATNAPTLHTLELYLDYVCPFSQKLYNTVYTSVFPLIKQKYASKVQILFRQQVQPWHPSSTLVHEAGVAVLKLQPNKFFDFSKVVAPLILAVSMIECILTDPMQALFDESKSFYDVNVVNETRNKTYERLAKIGGKVGVDEKKLYELLYVSDKPSADGSLNSGNGVTNELKVLIKMNRMVGIHVSPTVVFDGVVENGISSSFSAEQWEEWLEKNVA
ncbi:hypothetical protein B2J93_4019 [Marssonina coronariae]|uniref:Thioredoxin-like fold domain-containing protein n=1 Tax=Diplocarpon coronariae TaxID=2795749 RepID=A0A218Z9J5_9HELO|nr:hypothetical protein B2J93_4019 [Marssonina coronariae]